MRINVTLVSKHQLLTIKRNDMTELDFNYEGKQYRIELCGNANGVVCLFRSRQPCVKSQETLRFCNIGE